MANPRLIADQLTVANALLDGIRRDMRAAAGDDAAHYWALRRKIAKELGYDERGKPNHRRALKARKRVEQSGLCPECARPLPSSYCVLDRLHATDGYTDANTRLLCQECDFRIQRERGYADV